MNTENNNVEKKILNFIHEYVKENGDKCIKSYEIIHSLDFGISSNSLSRYLSILNNKGQVVVKNNGKNGLSFKMPDKQPSKEQILRNLLKNAVDEISLKDVKRYYNHILKYNKNLHGFPNEY